MGMTLVFGLNPGSQGARRTMRKPITPKGIGVISCVSELIDLVIKDWDHDILNRFFWEEGVQIIKTIPVLPRLRMSLTGILIIRDASRSNQVTSYKVQRQYEQRTSTAGMVSMNKEEMSDNDFWMKL